MLDGLPYLRKLSRKEFVKNLIEFYNSYNFQEKGHDIFRRWYVDGRIYYHKVIEKKNPRKGITELRYIDPQKIKKVREKI